MHVILLALIVATFLFLRRSKASSYFKVIIQPNHLLIKWLNPKNVSVFSIKISRATVFNIDNT